MNRWNSVAVLVALASLLALPAAVQALPIGDVSPGELNGMQELYAIDGNAFNSFDAAYTFNNSGSIATGSYTRVGYYFQLGNAGNSSPWVWVSFDSAITSSTVSNLNDPHQLGVPRADAYSTTVPMAFWDNGNVILHNLHVEAGNGAPVTTFAGDGHNGTLEFWNSNYGQGAGHWDWRENGGGMGGGHGSMKIFEFPGATSGIANTLFGVTRGGGSGIGNQNGNTPGVGDTSWTFATGLGGYSTHNLQIWVGTPITITDTLTWHNSDTGNWGATDWQSLPNPTLVAGPNIDTVKGIVGGGIVTVDANRTAHSLEQNGGQVIIGPGNTLTLAHGIASAPGTSLVMSPGSSLAVTGGGTINSLSVSGTATLNAGAGTVTVANTTMASSLVKAGAGTVNLQNVTAAPGSAFNVSAGTLAAQAPQFISNAGLVLSGGTFQVAGASTTLSGLAETIFNTATGDAQGSIEGYRTRALSLGPDDAKGLLTSALHYQDDAAVSTRAAALGAVGFDNGDFAMLWVTTFTPTENGAWGFRFGNVDDNASLWIDTDQNGTFEIGNRFYNRGCCGGSGDQFTASLTGGQTYKLGIVMSDTGGNGYFQNMEFKAPSGAWTSLNPSLTGQGTLWTTVATGPINMSTTNVAVTAGTTGSRISATTDSTASFGTLTFGAASDLTVSVSNPAALVNFTKITTNGSASLGLSGDVTIPSYDDQGIPGTFRMYGTKTLTLAAATIADVNAKGTNFQVDTGATFRVAGVGLLGGAPLVTLAGGTFTIAPVPAGSDAMMQLTDVSVIASSTINGATTGQVALGRLDFSAPRILTTGGTTSALSFLDTTIKAGGTVGFSTGVPTFTGALDGGGFTATLAKQGASDLIVAQGGIHLGGTTLEAQAGRLVLDGPSSVAGAKLNIAGGQIVLTSPTGSDQTYNNAITATANGILTAGTGGVGVASGNISVTSLTPALGTTVELRSEGAQALILPNGVTAPGSLNVTQGSVRVTNPLNVSTLSINGGTATLTANATLANSLVGSSGTLATQGNITITPQRALGLSGTLRVESGNLTVNVPTSGSPAALSGLLAWYDASTLALTNGAAVTTWADSSGNGRTANNPAGTVTYATNQIGGLPAVHFVGGSLQINSAMQVKEEYMVFRSANGATFGPDWGSVLGAQDGNGWMVQGGTTQFWTDGNHLPQAVAQNGTALPGSPYTLSNVGNYMVMKVDTSVNDSNAARTAYLGRNGGWWNSNFDIAEVLAFNRTLTATEQQNLGGYLAAKYSISTAYTGALNPSLGDVRLAGGTSVTLNGVPAAGISVNSIGAATAGPIATGPMQLTNIGAPAASANPAGTTVAIDATINAASFSVTGPGTIALTKNLTVTNSLTVAADARLSAQNTLAVNAGTGYVNVKGGLDVAGAPGTTLTFAVPAPGGSMPGGLQAWYDASRLNLANGAAVTTWNDFSGNGHTATKTTGTLTFATNQINGQPVVQFADNTYADTIGSMYSKEQYVVVKLDAGDWGAFLGSQTRGGYMLNQNGNFWDQNYPTAVKKNGVTIPAAPYSLGDDQPYMLLKITGNDFSTALRTYSLGRQEGWNRLVMSLAEILAFNTTLSAADENNIGGYLAKKYGISAPSYTGSFGAPSLGNLTMAPGTNLTLTGGGAAQFSSIRAGAGATITGNVTANGPVAPGSSPGTLNIIGNYTQAAGSSYEWETVGSGAGQSDLIAVTGNLDASANWTLSINPLAGVSSGMYNLFTYGGALTGGPAWPNVTLTKTGAYADLVNLGGSSIDSTLAGTVRLNLAMNSLVNWNSTGTAWNVASDWTPNTVPTATIAAIVNTNGTVATVLPAMGPQAALSLVVDNGRVLVDTGGVLNVANSANVTAIGQLTVNGTLSATALNTAGATAFGPAATLTTPLINVTGGTTTGNGTTLASNTTLRLAGGTLAGSFNATNPSTTANTYAYEVQAGTSNASLGGALASLRKSTAGAAILNGSVNLNRVDVAAGSLTMKGGVMNSLDVTGGSSLTLTDSVALSQSLTGAGSLVTQGTMTITPQQSLSLSGTLSVASGNLTISVPSSVAAPAGAAALYTFDNISGGQIVNQGSLGTAKNATLNDGATIPVGTGHMGNGVYISGWNGGDVRVLQGPGSVGLDLSGGNWTASIWYKDLIGGNDWHTLFHSGSTDDYQTIVNEGNRQIYSLWGGNQNSGYVLPSGDTGWHMFTTVGSPGATKFYIDGAYVSQTTWASSSDIFSIGAHQSNVHQFARNLDDFYFYQSALPPAQIQTLYQAGLSGTAALGDVRLASGTQLTLTGAGQPTVKSIGTTGGPIATGPMQFSNFGAPTATSNPAGTTVAIDATINATNFNVTGPGTITLTKPLTVTGNLSVAADAKLSAQSTLAITANASTAWVNVKGGLDVAGAPGTTLTFAVPAVGTMAVPGLGTSLQAWYDASTLSLANGATVATWNDLSGNGRTATYNSGTVTYAPTDANGLPAVHFISGILNINSAMLATDQYLVFRSGYGTVFGPDWGAVLGRQDGNSWMFQGNTTNTWDQHRPQAIVENGVSMPTAGPLTNVNQYMVMKIKTNADNNAAATYYLGRNGGWGNNNLDIAEVLAFNVPLSATDENNLGGYLAKKYGISAPGYTGSIGLPNLGHLTMAPGTNLTLIGGAAAAFESITTGNGATITGNVINLGPVAPGSSPGILNILGDLIMDDGSSYLWELGASAEDRIVLTGDLELDDWTLRIIDAGGDSYAWQKHYIFTGFTSLSGPNNVTFDLSQAPLWAQFTTNLELGIDGGGLYLVGLNSMPEPTSLTLLALGGLALWRRRRRAS